MAKKKKSKSIDLLIYLVIRSVVCLLQALPRPVAFSFADVLAGLAYRIDKRHRLVAAENLRHAFPERCPAEIDCLVRDCYRHFCRMLVEIVILPRVMGVESWRYYAGMTNSPFFANTFLSSRPVLMVTGHFGNWELAGYTLGAMGFKTHAIARVLDNPYLESFLKRFRQATGQTIVAKKQDFERLTHALKSGAKVATLADQDAGTRGVFVEFFGRPASAHKAVALMAMEYDALMVVAGVPRIGERPMQFCLDLEEVIDPRDYADRSDAIAAITQRYHAALERLIRRHPEQYFWLHRRWKSQPVRKTAPGRSLAA